MKRALIPGRLYYVLPAPDQAEPPLDVAVPPPDPVALARVSDPTMAPLSSLTTADTAQTVAQGYTSGTVAPSGASATVAVLADGSPITGALPEGATVTVRETWTHSTATGTVVLTTGDAVAVQAASFGRSHSSSYSSSYA